MGTSASIIMKNNKNINAISFDNIEVNDTYINSRNQEGMEDETPEEEIILFSFDELLAQIKTDIGLYEQNKDILYLQSAIEIFGKIPKISESLSNNIVMESKELNEIFESIRLYCYNLDSTLKQESYVQMFAEKIFLGWKYNKNITHYKDKFLIEGLVKYNIGKLPNIQNRLDYLEYVARYYVEYGDPYPEHESIPEIVLPEDPLPDKEEDGNGNNGGNNNNNNNNNSNNNNNNNNNINNKPNGDNNVANNINNTYDSIIKFKRSGNKCYKVEETYRNGKKISSKKILADKSDYVQCSIYDYVDFGSNVLSPVIEIDKDYLYNSQNEDSEYFAYYTVTKGDKTPYYYNTGIRANSEDNSLSYNQLSDILYQLTIKTNAFNVKSNSKSLFIIDGKPIVLDKNENPTYTKLYVENMLNEYPNLGIKIMKSSEYKSSLDKYNEENIDRNYINSITVDDTEVTESNIAWIDDDETIKTSIQTIAKILGANTKVTDDKLIINKDGIEIVIQNNSKEYYINGEISSFLNESYKNKNIFVSELADIPQKLGYNVDFDSDKNKLEFKKIT